MYLGKSQHDADVCDPQTMDIKKIIKNPKEPLKVTTFMYTI